MKDIYVINQNIPTVGPSRITVREERAPTDDSIRLYEEMSEKAKKNIIKLFEVDDNSFNCVVFKNMDGANSFGPVLIAVFKLNGAKITVEQEMLIDHEQTVRQLFVKMSEEIAKVVLSSALKELYEHGIS